jgi:hypothetical protein
MKPRRPQKNNLFGMGWIWVAVSMGNTAKLEINFFLKFNFRFVDMVVLSETEKN